MKPADKNWLHHQWQQLMDFFNVDPAEGEAVFDDLVIRYEENGRYYHTLRHIQNVLETIGSFRSQAGNFQAIQLAAWFHDAIYDVRRNDNEAESTVYAEKVLQKLGVPADTIALVGPMILATRHNGVCPTDVDCQIMLDADLATFASDWALQEEIEKAIRQEYDYVPDEAYVAGRKIILQHFLDRDRIYCTEQMHTEREAAARQNISRTVELLLG